MKTRRSHLLAGNKGSQRPQDVIFFDTETRGIPISPDEKQHVLRLGWACYYRSEESGHKRRPQWFYFTTPEAFWDFVESRCISVKKLYLVAHNVGFDLRIVNGFSHLERLGWEESFSYNKGLTTILRYKRAKQSLEILSSTNFFGMSLRKVGDMVGLEKVEVSFDRASDKELSQYCKRDVEIVLRAWKLWVDFLDEHDLGSFKRTISSQAFASYRHRFMHTPISIHGNMKVCQFEREAYRGGRTECFRVGVFPEEPYYYLDVNGMYAHQMESQLYPHKLVGTLPTLSKRLLQNKLRNFAAIARVVVNTEEPAFVTKHNKRNVYPIGRFEVVLTTPDLKYALDHDMIERVKDVAWYKQAPIFRSYTHYFTKLKARYELEGNLAFRGIAKLYINALYGKFGQVAEKPKASPLDKPNLSGLASILLLLKGKLLPRPPKHSHIDLGIINVDTGTWVKPTPTTPKKRAYRNIEETYNSFPAVVAHVTAYARQYLWALIKQAGRENTFYCDTDSLIVNQCGLDNLAHLLHPTKPGYLKIEKEGSNLTIFAPKDYVIADRVRLKGIRQNATEIGEGSYSQDQFLGLAGAVRRGDNDLVTIKRVIKTLARHIKTGTVSEDGRVIPFRLPL